MYWLRLGGAALSQVMSIIHLNHREQKVDILKIVWSDFRPYRVDIRSIIAAHISDNIVFLLSTIQYHSSIIIHHSFINIINYHYIWWIFSTERQSATKQRIYLPLFDQAQCIEQYRAIRIDVDGTQLCAGGIDQQDTCDGDSGNALMKVASSTWIVEGVVSYGRSCGVQDRPAIYTRVSAFDQWIRSRLRP